MSTVSPDWLPRTVRERLAKEYEAQAAQLAQLTTEPGDSAEAHTQAAEAHTRDAMIARPERASSNSRRPSPVSTRGATASARSAARRSHKSGWRSGRRHASACLARAGAPG